MCQVQAGRLLGTYPELWKIVGLLQLACHALRLGFSENIAGAPESSLSVGHADDQIGRDDARVEEKPGLL